MTSVNGRRRRYEETTPQSRIPALILPRVSLTYDPENFYWTTNGFELAYPNPTAGQVMLVKPLIFSGWTGGAQGGGTESGHGQWTCITNSCNLVQLGSQSYQRTGRSILVTRIELKANIEQQQGYDLTLGNGYVNAWNIITIQIWLDKQFNGGNGLTQTNAQTYVNSLVPLMFEEPEGGLDSWGTGSRLNFTNRANESRFILLKEQTIDFNVEALAIALAASGLYPSWDQANPGYTPYQPSPQGKSLYWDINDIQIPIMFDDTQTPGSLATVTSNNIFVMVNSVAGWSNPAVSHNSRITYKQLP